MRRYRAAVLFPTALLLGAGIAGCGNDADEPDAAAPATTAPAASASVTASMPVPAATATFVPYAAGAAAVTYDPALVPAGATAALSITPADAGTAVRLAVTGLQPGRGYGAHLHVDACGPTGEAAGPHHQQQPDAAAAASPPSVDPSYANPRNEVWLDFTTDTDGNATTTATQPWTVDQARTPRSLIIHAQTTETGPGEAGQAGARVGCLTLPA